MLNISQIYLNTNILTHINNILLKFNQLHQNYLFDDSNYTELNFNIIQWNISENHKHHCFPRNYIFFSSFHFPYHCGTTYTASIHTAIYKYSGSGVAIIFVESCYYISTHITYALCFMYNFINIMYIGASDQKIDSNRYRHNSFLVTSKSH